MSKSLYTTIKETTPPTTATVGIVGQKYLDTTTKKYYICTNIDNSVYTWEELAKSADLNSKLNASGGTISGNLAVQGNLTVTGETTTEKQKELEVEDNFIYTNANKVNLTALLSGIAIYKNGTDIYAIAYDPATDSVKLGLGTRDAQGVFHFNTGEGSPVAVRVDSAELTDNHIIVWDATNHKFIDSGKTIADLDNRDIGVELNVPNTATNGTLTESQLQILQSNNSNYIILDHEIYKIGGSGHKAGYLTYNCNEYENSTTYLKFITITINTRGWVLNTSTPANADGSNISSPATWLNKLGIKCELLYSGSLTNGQTTTLETAPTYDLLMCCWDGWKNTGGVFIVPTTKITPGVADNKWTYGSMNAGTNGSIKGTTCWARINLDNSTGKIECYGGYDGTQEANQSFVRRIYGIKLPL